MVSEERRHRCFRINREHTYLSNVQSGRCKHRMTLRGICTSMCCWQRVQISIMRYKMFEEELKPQSFPFRGRRDSAVVKSIQCSYRKPELGSPMGQLIPTGSSNSRDPTTSFGLPMALAHQHTHIYVPTVAQIPSQREAKQCLLLYRSPNGKLRHNSI